MGFPTKAEEMEPAGYKLNGFGTCRGCGEKMEWYISPRGKKIPMNVMPNPSSPAVAHWTTCKESPLFRDKAKPQEEKRPEPARSVTPASNRWRDEG